MTKKPEQTPEMARLIAVMDRIPGVRGIQARDADIDDHARIFFCVTELRWLFFFSRACDRNYGGYAFSCTIDSADSDEIAFCLASSGGGLLGPELCGAAATGAVGDLAERLEWLLSAESLNIRSAYGVMLPDDPPYVEPPPAKWRRGERPGAGALLINPGRTRNT